MVGSPPDNKLEDSRVVAETHPTNCEYGMALKIVQEACQNKQNGADSS